MNVGVCVNFVSMETMEHKVKLVREQGFDTIQLLCWDPSLWTEENAVTMKPDSGGERRADLRILVRVGRPLYLELLRRPENAGPGSRRVPRNAH